MLTVSCTRLRDEPAAQHYVATVTAVEASSLPSPDDIKPPSGRITMPVSHVQSSLSRALDGTGRLGYDSNDNGANKDSNDRDSHGIYWLADLLPNDIPNARILAWSYGSNYCDDGCSQGYTAIFWFNARDEAALKQGFERVADRILHEHPSVPYIKDALSDNDPELQVQAVRKWLAIKENKRWLVIYDHYDPAGKEFNIVPYLPRKIESHGTVIITTRSAQENLGHRIKVGKLKSLEERQLAQRFDITAYRSQAFDAQANDSQTPVLHSTWNISFAQVERQNSKAANLLRLWAYFGPEDLWFELLAGAGVCGKGPVWFQDQTRDLELAQLAMRCLAELSRSREALRPEGVHGRPETLVVEQRLMRHVDQCRKMASKGTTQLQRGEEWIPRALGALYLNHKRSREGELMLV
ncbi:hypothetical protein VTJ04DRAFT_1231 [Mycothermus thermophilus]|uniref:uncharacterized protein n=1 Tax=Humicola insolens TaxID=85995 RepID=UPI003743ACDB